MEQLYLQVDAHVSKRSLAMAESTQISWKALVDAIENQKGRKDKDVAYRFSNGREFEREKDVYGWAD
jgi:hypothetical protein